MYVFFIYSAVFWWALSRGMILCYLLTNPYVCGEVSFADDCVYYIGARVLHVDNSLLPGDERVCGTHLLL